MYILVHACMCKRGWLLHHNHSYDAIVYCAEHLCGTCMNMYHDSLMGMRTSSPGAEHVGTCAAGFFESDGYRFQRNHQSLDALISIFVYKYILPTLHHYSCEVKLA